MKLFKHKCLALLALALAIDACSNPTALPTLTSPGGAPTPTAATTNLALPDVSTTQVTVVTPVADQPGTVPVEGGNTPASTPPTLASTPVAQPATALPASPPSPPTQPIAENPPSGASTQGLRGPNLPGVQSGFTLIGHTTLESRGENAGLALAYPCAYIGSHSRPQVAIVDVTDPTNPKHVGTLQTSPGSAVEVATLPDLGLLVVLNFSRAESVIVYDVRDCRNPVHLGSLGLGGIPHEFYVWRDPVQPGRVLVYVAMFGGRPDLNVVDMTDRSQPRLVARWSPADDGVEGVLHSLTVSLDGTRAYLALWNGGLLVADISAVMHGQRDAQIHVLRSDNGPAPLPGTSTHSAVRVPGRPELIVTHEVYTCPYAALDVVDIGNEARPQRLGTYRVPENQPGTCAHLPGADAIFTAHNPTVVGDLVFVTWYGAGLQVLNIADPAHPQLIARFVPQGSGAAAISRLGRYLVQTWSYPIVRQGLVYVVDVQSGLYILKYTGAGSALVQNVRQAGGMAQ